MAKEIETYVTIQSIIRNHQIIPPNTEIEGGEMEELEDLIASGYVAVGYVTPVVAPASPEDDAEGPEFVGEDVVAKEDENPAEELTEAPVAPKAPAKKAAPAKRAKKGVK